MGSEMCIRDRLCIGQLCVWRAVVCDGGERGGRRDGEGRVRWAMGVAMAGAVGDARRASRRRAAYAAGRRVFAIARDVHGERRTGDASVVVDEVGGRRCRRVYRVHGRACVLSVGRVGSGRDAPAHRAALVPETSGTARCFQRGGLTDEVLSLIHI